MLLQEGNLGNHCWSVYRFRDPPKPILNETIIDLLRIRIFPFLLGLMLSLSFDTIVLDTDAGHVISHVIVRFTTNATYHTGKMYNCSIVVLFTPIWLFIIPFKQNTDPRSFVLVSSFLSYLIHSSNYHLKSHIYYIEIRRTFIYI
jgi:hypothetical protein